MASMIAMASSHLAIAYTVSWVVGALLARLKVNTHCQRMRFARSRSAGLRGCSRRTLGMSSVTMMPSRSTIAVLLCVPPRFDSVVHITVEQHAVPCPELVQFSVRSVEFRCPCLVLLHCLGQPVANLLKVGVAFLQELDHGIGTEEQNLPLDQLAVPVRHDLGQDVMPLHQVGGVSHSGVSPLGW